MNLWDETSINYEQPYREIPVLSVLDRIDGNEQQSNDESWFGIV